jgi:hypothetical protein
MTAVDVRRFGNTSQSNGANEYTVGRNYFHSIAATVQRNCERIYDRNYTRSPETFFLTAPFYSNNE